MKCNRPDRYGPGMAFDGASVTSALGAALLLGTLALWAGAVARGGLGSYPGLRATAFAAGIATVGVTVLSPLDDWGRGGLVLAQIAQHIALGDVAAPLLLLGLPTLARRRLREYLERPRASALGKLVAGIFTPVGAVVLWAGVTYLWFVPAVHITSVPAGPVHVLDHASFLVLGLLVWLPAFDPRPARAAGSATSGALPWWGRHLYAMIARAAMLPPAFALWLGSPESWHRQEQLPFGFSPKRDQVAAASGMVGFEMILFALAIVLGFIFLSVAEGHRRTAEG